MMRAWGSVEWIEPVGDRVALGPCPRQVQRAFSNQGLDAIAIGVIGRDADGNTFLLNRAAAALEAELSRRVLNNIMDAMGFEEVRP
jgi:hypothetical protein